MVEDRYEDEFNFSPMVFFSTKGFRGSSCFERGVLIWLQNGQANTSVKYLYFPKSTASLCLVPIRTWKGRARTESTGKKFSKKTPRRVLSSRCCLRPSLWAIWDKVLLHSFLQTPFVSRVLNVPLAPTRMVHSQAPGSAAVPSPIPLRRGDSSPAGR